MKIRLDFVTNSSSIAYVIRNRTNKEKTMLDFAKEIIHMLDQYNEDNSEFPVTREEYLDEAEDYGWSVGPNSEAEIVLHWENDFLGIILTQYLGHGSSESFSWRELPM